MLRHIGGFLFGGALGVSVMLYMDDIVYLPVRRAFIRPVAAYYTTVPGEYNASNPQNFKDVIYEVKDKGADFFREMKPRNVSLDNVKDYVQDEDFRTREDHYFSYIRRRKQEAEDRQEREQPFVEKHSKDEYNKLKRSTLKDFYSVYESTKQGRAVEYKEFDTFPDMLHIISKTGKRRDQSQNIESELNEVLGKTPSKSKALLDQSIQFQTPNEREERAYRLEEMKKLEETIKLKPDTLKQENISKFLTSYEGKYSIREVGKKDKQKLQKLRDKAVEPDLEYEYQNSEIESNENLEGENKDNSKANIDSTEKRVAN